ncbi:MAG: ATP-binding protein [Candidatus Howiella sp.]|jgi:DNA replication protein DnaC
MSFGKEIMAAAMAQKEAQRKAAERTASRKKADVYAARPELTALDMQISAAGSRLAVTALSGGDLSPLREEIRRLSDKRAALLQSVGCGPEDFKPAYTCAACQDTGFVNGRVCACVNTLCAKLSCERMSAEMPLADSRFDNFDLSFYTDRPGENGLVPRKQMAAILAYCKSYAESFSRESGNLLLMGNTGLGKTHLSLAIASGVIERGFGVVYGPASRLFERVEREKFSGAGSGYKDALLGCDLLIVDDLGTEFSTPFTVALVNDLVNTRILEKRPTVISTNFGFKELAEKYTSRVTSRLIGCYTVRQFIGQDVRQQLQMQKAGGR